MKTDPECIFCKIVKGDIPSYKIAENDKFLAFLDISQFTEGHTLVIPKEHFEFIWDVPNIGEYFEFVKKVGNHYREIGFKYVDTLTFGRMVNHAHVHLVPHNGDKEWSKALHGLHLLQIDQNRRLTPEKGKILVEKFKLPE